MTDGTDSVVFAAGTNTVTNYPPVRGQWGPNIAGVRQSQLGGRGPYADVEEDLSCNIRNTTAALCWQNLDTLTRLLDKAERWWLRNEPISPVLLKYAAQGSTIHSNATPMQAIVLGRASENELNGVDLPSNVNDAGMLFEIYGVKVKCLRRGAWTGTIDASATSGSAASATVFTRTFTTHPVNSPVDVVIGGFTGATTPTIQSGLLMVGSASGDINVYEGETMAGGVYTSVADAANLARGGSVLRYTPAGTTNVASSSQALSISINGPIAVYAAVRNNSATTTFQVRAVIQAFGGAATTPPCLVDTSSTLPRLMLIGIVNVTGASGLQVQVQASAASGTLDIDYLIVVNLRNETVAVIAHDAIDCSTFSAGAFTLQAVYNPVTDQYPVLKAVSGGGAVAIATYRGALPLLTTADTLYALWTATNSNYWRFTNVSNAIVNVTLQATRYRSFLSPQ